MPWCEQCSQFQDAEALTPEGRCPACDSLLVPKRRSPWHFRLLVAGTSIYLTYRLVQGILWVSHHV